MELIKVERIINAPIEKVWEVIYDFPKVHLYSPVVESAYSISDLETGLGAQRICHFYDGTKLVEEITNYQEMKFMDIAVNEGLPRFMKQPSGSFEVQSVGANQTKVTVAFKFNMGLGILGKLMLKLMLRKQFKKSFVNTLKSLEDHITTGSHIGKSGVILSRVESEKELSKLPLLQVVA